MSAKIKQLVPALLGWFTACARDLPWRKTQDPYAIWVSEIMLQQTQVKTVIPYWERWMRALPTIANLAKAKPETIHKLWEGLGYYTRVRNMQRAAQEIIAQHNGEFPRDYEAILALPGIGRYTAGAISSIAFNQPQPILDGNVIRVLTRVFGIAENPKDKSTNAQLWQLAQELVTSANEQEIKREKLHTPSPPSGERAGVRGHVEKWPHGENWVEAANHIQTIGPCSALNQSLMELGALICTPKQPQCLICPLQKFCDAYKTGHTQLIPNLGPRVTVTEREFIAFVIEHRGRYLVRQRPEGQVNAHLWEFPNMEVLPEPESSEKAKLSPNRSLAWCRRFSVSGEGPAKAGTPYQTLAQLVEKHLGLQVESLTELCTIRHTITRYRITLRACRGSGKLKFKNKKLKMEWLALADLDKLAFTSAHRKILKQLQIPAP